jgi:hypothetical protein
MSLLVKPMAYPQLYPPDNDDEEVHPTGVLRTMFVDQLDHHATEAIVDYLHTSTAPVRVAQLRVLGGAMARVPTQATAFGHRTSRFLVNLAALYQPPQDPAPQLGRPLRRRPPRRRGPAGLCQLPRRRRPGPHPPGLPRPNLGPARRHQGPL